MDLYRITHPLRLAKGSHQPGSGKGCAMNVISYTDGDPEITDFPTCSARPLAAFVQSCNDLMAGPDGYLSPENSLLALELGWETVGTADVAGTVVHAWVAGHLADGRSRHPAQLAAHEPLQRTHFHVGQRRRGTKYGCAITSSPIRAPKTSPRPRPTSW
jgi:hypothetical protein